MKIRRKRIFLFISISLCGILYIFHYVQLNSYYQKRDTVRDEIYYIGQEISLGENNIGGSMQANGYSIRVNGLKIADTKDYIESFNRFLIISLDVLICRYSPLFRAFPALFISEEPHKSFYYPLCFRSQK